MDINQIKAIIEKNNIDNIKVGGTDIDGIWRGKRIPSKEFVEVTAKSGLKFCDVLFGWDIQNEIYMEPHIPKYSGWHTGFPDLTAMPILDTFKIVPGEKNTASVLCDYYHEKDHKQVELEISPRAVLKRLIKKAGDMGFDVFSATELEFYLYDETTMSLCDKDFSNPRYLNPGISCYNIIRGTALEEVFGEMRRRIEAYGIELEASNTEYGPGQFEVNVKYSECLEQADKSVLFKTMIKEIATEKGLFATFMSKPYPIIAGNGLHVHQSLWYKDAKKNAFYDANAEHGASDVLRWFLGGLISTIHEFLPMYAPTVNDYKRYVEDSYAPTNQSWGHDNRTVAFRMIAEGPNSARIENRSAGAAANLYLAKAAMLAAGLYGVENKIEPDMAWYVKKGSGYDLGQTYPRSLAKAIPAMENSAIAKEYLGEWFVEHYLDTRKWEVYLFDRSVTEWERIRYIEHV